ncbi:hypothetical protein [Autumnicola musiva]|uniref:Uncharacterized protein n=1 Tax=Autumnicola musiva TaxID=3075589 RepID=A0ABU3D0P2_9FLAO|nr:hypothetical protein [Zunongwangia sp. F117]MDT0675115.1 hypothetical protein [Zunongwangia sp. F117]
MNKEQQEEFENQKKQSILKNLNILNNDPKFANIKKCYFNNFETIKSLILSSNSHLAIEDINELCQLDYNKMDSFVMKDINNGIQQNIINKSNII